ncbi:probable serine/threonine-protein kinase clkA [Gordionus sp. m RMFG-2023]|uniref:probable serine/threonine-protein kinase clkA n=1 Tax=Gordionus sp. m RMFG-2023 TaxID=3053472 RepID=UPI0031FD6882
MFAFKLINIPYEISVYAILFELTYNCDVHDSRILGSDDVLFEFVNLKDMINFGPLTEIYLDRILSYFSTSTLSDSIKINTLLNNLSDEVFDNIKSICSDTDILDLKIVTKKLTYLLPVQDKNILINKFNLLQQNSSENFIQWYIRSDKDKNFYNRNRNDNNNYFRPDNNFRNNFRNNYDNRDRNRYYNNNFRYNDRNYGNNNSRYHDNYNNYNYNNYRYNNNNQSNYADGNRNNYQSYYNNSNNYRGSDNNQRKQIQYNNNSNNYRGGDNNNRKQIQYNNDYNMNIEEIIEEKVDSTKNKNDNDFNVKNLSGDQ